MSTSSHHPVFRTRLHIAVFAVLDRSTSDVALARIKSDTEAHPSTLSNAVRTLEAASYLTVARRGRNAYLSATARGREAFRRLSRAETLQREGEGAAIPS